MTKLEAIVAASLAFFATTASAAPIDDAAWKGIANLLAVAATAARSDRPDDALRNCDAARLYAARYDDDAHTAGKIEICFGLAALFRKDKAAACAAYARALPLLARADPRHADMDIDRVRRGLHDLGC